MGLHESLGRVKIYRNQLINKSNMAADTYTFNIDNVIAVTKYSVTNFSIPEYQGGFDNQAFWKLFCKKNAVVDEKDLVLKVLDMTRAHFSPKIENWPGMDIVVSYGATGAASTWNLNLPAGKSSVSPAVKGQGLYSWTNFCIATGAIFEEVFRQSDKVNTSAINGNWQGATQFMTLVKGFDESHYDKCVQALEVWIKSIGSKARDPNIKGKIEKAAKNAIKSKTDKTCALTIANIARVCAGNAIDPASS